jgi:hypothetical protein
MGAGPAVLRIWASDRSFFWWCGFGEAGGWAGLMFFLVVGMSLGWLFWVWIKLEEGREDGDNRLGTS